ncbi:MAG: KH domain-containing protein [Bacilli bacterium]
MIEEYEKILRAAIEPLVKEPESLIIRCIDSKETVETSRDVHFIIVCPDDELGKLIGRHGSVADSIRTIVNIKARDDRKRVHLKFQSFSEE